MRSRGNRPSSTPISASRIKEHYVIALGQFLEVVIGGLLSGVMYSLVALGFVLIFKASGVFNFAQGTMVLFAALTFVGMMERGVPIWGAFVIAAAVMVLLAIAIERL